MTIKGIPSRRFGILRITHLLIFFLIIVGFLKTAKAQDTFGPICDDVTVTCAPTESPTETPTPTELPPGYPTPIPTDTPTETPTPTDTPTPTETPTPTTFAGRGGQPESPTPTELMRAGAVDNLEYILTISASLITVGFIGQIASSKKRN